MRSFDNRKVLQFDFIWREKLEVLIYIRKDTGKIVKASFNTLDDANGLKLEEMRLAYKYAKRRSILGWNRSKIRTGVNTSDLHKLEPYTAQQKAVWVVAWLMVLRREYKTSSSWQAFQRLVEFDKYSASELRRHVQRAVKLGYVKMLPENFHPHGESRREKSALFERLAGFTKAGKEKYQEMVEENERRYATGESVDYEDVYPHKENFSDVVDDWNTR